MPLSKQAKALYEAALRRKGLQENFPNGLDEIDW